LAHTAPNLVAPAFKSGFATLAAAGAAAAAAFAGSLAMAKVEIRELDKIRAASNFMAQKE
jgi:cobalamin biosynthesis protein CbiD